MATAAAAVRGCFAATSGRSAVAVARSAVRAQAGAFRTVPTRSMFGGLFGGKKEKREVGVGPQRRGCSGGSSGGGGAASLPEGTGCCQLASFNQALSHAVHFMLQGKNDEVLKMARSAKKGTELAPATPPEGLEIATVAGGCFWGE